MPSPSQIAALAKSLGEAGLINLDARASDLTKAISALDPILESQDGGPVPDDAIVTGWYAAIGSGYVLVVPGAVASEVSSE